TWRKNDELLQAARDYASCALNEAGDGCGGSYNADVPNFDIYPLDDDGNFVFDYDYSLFTLQPDSSLVPWDSNLYNYAPINHFQRPDERWSAGAFIDYEIDEHAVAYVEIMLANDETRAQIAESGTFFYEGYPLPISNALFPDSFVASLEEYFPEETGFAVYIGKRNTEGGPRLDALTHGSFRIVAGMKGVISENWNYDVSYLHAQTTSGSTYINDFLAPRIFPAVNAELCVATDGCIPYEVFTYQGVTHEQAASLSGTASSQNVGSTDVFNAYATGALPWGLSAGPVMAVAGFEWHQQSYITHSDTLYEEGLLIGQGGAIPSIDGGYRVSELFTEANIPLLADKSWSRMMVLDLAYRWSDYTTSGPSSTYRVGLDWQMTDALRIRTNYNGAVRTPNLKELYTPQTLGLSVGGGDPCDSATPEYSFEQCARTGVTAEQYGRIPANPLGAINFMDGGNPGLEPEKADTLTFGLVIDPTETMQISIDYWDIRIKGVISKIDPYRTLLQCAEFGALCDSIHRGVGGTLWIGNSGWVDATKLNISEKHWRGIDAAWAWSLGDHWNFDLIGTYMLKKEVTEIPNDPDSVYDCVGLISWECWPSPKWRHAVTATYDSNSFWALTGRWRFYGNVEYEGTEDPIANDTLGAQNYIDLSATFRFMGNHDVVVGVNNVFDEEPPLMGSTLSWGANTIAGFWDTLGRYLYANVTLRW
ncbi:MAG: TonB-dependent receptor, partial [Xanthomonadales bacterium]|nr:TonB-dependent receptor [Xanthomonadales bacterium]